MSDTICPKCGAGASRQAGALPRDSAIWACGSYSFGILTQSKQCRIRELENKLTVCADVWTRMRGEICYKSGWGHNMIDSVLDIIDKWEGQL